MAYGIQCCVKCGKLEDGHTGYGSRYICADDYLAGWRLNAFGKPYRIAPTPDQEG